MSDQLTGKNRLETGFSDILKKKYPNDFAPKKLPSAIKLKSTRRCVKKQLEEE